MSIVIADYQVFSDQMKCVAREMEVGEWDTMGGSLSKTTSVLSGQNNRAVSGWRAPHDQHVATVFSQPWFALQVRTHYENSVALFLGAKGYEWFLPLFKCRRYWSDRIKEMDLPLFPGYVFCRFNPQNRLPILKTPRVLSVVGIGRSPIPIDEAEMAALQAAVQSGLPSRPWPFLQTGQRVRVEYGPLCGKEGILLDFKGHHRLVLSLTLLQRSVAVEVDDAWVIPVPQQASC